MLWLFMNLVGNNVKTLSELYEHTLYFIKVGPFTMAHIFQYQFLNQVQKVNTMQHTLQEWI